MYVGKLIIMTIIRDGKFMFVRNELRQLHEGSQQTGDTIDWNGYADDDADDGDYDDDYGDDGDDGDHDGDDDVDDNDYDDGDD